MAQIETLPHYGEVIIMSKQEFLCIASTNPEECWICEEIYNHIHSIGDGRYFIVKKWLDDEDFLDHFEQMILLEESTLDKIT